MINRLFWGKTRKLGENEEARHMVFGADQTTRQARKTKKGAAELLRKDDEARKQGKKIFNDNQRQALLDRAGKAYTTGRRKKEQSPWERRECETEEQYVARLTLIAKRV